MTGRIRPRRPSRSRIQPFPLPRLRILLRTRRVQVLLACAVALVVAAVAVLTAVSRAGSPDGGPSGSQTRTATIGLMAPMSGDLASVGTAVRNAVRLAVDEANADGASPGWKIRVSVQDDLSRPDGGAQAAGELAADDTVIGVVGPLSSTVAMVAMPTLSAAGIAVVSPSNSQPGLTGLDTAPPRARPYRTYFRLSGTDALQARTGAEYAVRTMGRSRIAVVDGGPDFGVSLAERFTSDARDLGATVTGIHKVHGSTDDPAELDAVAGQLRDEIPDLVYVATGYAFAAKLRNELDAHGPSVSVLGSDGLFDPRYPRRTQSASEGDVVTDLGAPLSELPQAGSFAAAYLQRWGGDVTNHDTNRDGSGHGSGGDRTATSAATHGKVPRASDRPNPAASPSPSPDVDAIPPVAAYAYDATRALLRAAGGVLPGRGQVDAATRAAIVTAVGEGRFPGVTGEVGFDVWGDAVAPVVTVYAVRVQLFVPVGVYRP